jgi:pimeloyl-ACP methyl ester carboxylesterase
MMNIKGTGKIIHIISACALIAVFHPEFINANNASTIISSNISEKERYIDEPVFNGRVLLYESGNNNNQTLLLVHGIGDLGMRIWLDILPDIEQRYHVLAFDLPGFGKSDKNNELYTPKNYALFIHWIIERYSKTKPILIGHSLGGAIALYYAGAWPLSIKGLMLIDAAGILHRTAFLENTTVFNAAEKNSITKRPASAVRRIIGNIIQNIDSKIMPKKFENAIELSLLREKLLGADPARVAAISLIDSNLAPQIDAVSVPIKIIWGENDPVAPPRTGKMLNFRIKNSELFIIPDAYHSPMLEKPEIFRTLFNETLKFTIPKISKIENSKAQYPDLKIKAEKNRTITGNYNDIEISDSSEILVENANARTITIRNSIVSLSGIKISSGQTGLIAYESHIRITGADISGEICVETYNSTLDAAGMYLYPKQTAVLCKRHSNIIFSACRISKNNSHIYLHEARKMHQDDFF